MTIKELRMDMMKSKKTDPERAKVLQAVLGAAQLIAKEDGNREATDKDIVAAAKKEMKMAQQSKDAGAPFNPITFEVCESFLPKMMSEDELKTTVETIISAGADNIGAVMGKLKTEYEGLYDGKMASGIVRAALA